MNDKNAEYFLGYKHGYDAAAANAMRIIECSRMGLKQPNTPQALGPSVTDTANTDRSQGGSGTVPDGEVRARPEFQVATKIE